MSSPLYQITHGPSNPCTEYNNLLLGAKLSFGKKEDNRNLRVEARQKLLCTSCYISLATLNLLSGLAHQLLAPLFIVPSDSLCFLVPCVVEVAKCGSLQAIYFIDCVLLLQVWELGTWCNRCAHSSGVSQASAFLVM